MGELSGRRVVDGKEAPTLLVVYLCRTCGAVATLDAYDGPPVCHGEDQAGGGQTGGHPAHPAAFMDPRQLGQDVIRNSVVMPDDVIAEMERSLDGRR